MAKGHSLDHTTPGAFLLHISFCESMHATSKVSGGWQSHCLHNTAEHVAGKSSSCLLYSYGANLVTLLHAALLLHCSVDLCSGRIVLKMCSFSYPKHGLPLQRVI